MFLAGGKHSCYNKIKWLLRMLADRMEGTKELHSPDMKESLRYEQTPTLLYRMQKWSLWCQVELAVLGGQGLMWDILMFSGCALL